MNLKLLFAGIGVLAGLAGTALWVGTRAPGSAAVPLPTDLTPAAIQAAQFQDGSGQPATLARFPGKVVVVNFWATWCAPCREEMPGFVRLQERWQSRGVQFVGLSNEDRQKVERFSADLRVNYPLWTGGEEVMTLSRRLGNRLGVLPHTAILDRDGRVLDSRIGLYSEEALEQKLALLAAKTQ